LTIGPFIKACVLCTALPATNDNPYPDHLGTTLFIDV
jgi:hypothetical protein